MSHQSFPKATGTITDGYVLTYVASDGYWAPRSIGQTWQTVYDVNFSTLPTQSFSGNGSVTIDGKLWTVENFAAATSFGIVNGTGLQFTCNTSNTDYNNSTRNGLILSTKVSNLYPQFGLTNHKVRITGYVTNNADQNFEFFVFGFEDSDSPTSLNYTLLKGYQNGAMLAQKGTLAGSSSANLDTTNTNDNVLQVTANLPTHFEMNTGSYSGNFPTQDSLRQRRVYMRSGEFTPSISNSQDLNVVFSAITNNTSGNFVANIIRFKVEVLAPGGSASTSTVNVVDSNAQFTPVLDNVVANGSYPSTVATNWSGSYTADGYSKVIIMGTASGGMGTSGAQIHLNLKIDGATVKTVSRYSNTNGIHVTFPTLFYSTILSAGSHTIALTQTGTSAFNDTNDFASIWVYKVANVTNIGWTATKTANFTASTSDTYIPVDTTSGAVTITLPPSPDNGERHTIADVGGLAATNNIIVNGNGRNITGYSTYVITGPYNTLEVAYHAGKDIWVII